MKSPTPRVSVQDFTLLAEPRIPHAPEQLIDSLFDSPGIGIAICDKHFRFDSINQALASMNGVPRKAHFGKTVDQVLGEPGMRICSAFERVFETGIPICNFELIAKLPTKRSMGRWVENFFPLFDPKGKVSRVGVVVVEVTHINPYPPLAPIPNSDVPLAQIDCVSVPPRRQNPLLRSADAQLFRNLDNTTIDRIMKAARPCTRRHKEVFCRQGERSMSLTLLLQGLVKVGGTTDTGKEVLLDWMHAGEVFGLGALVSPPAENVWTIYSDGYTEALEWDQASITGLSVSCPQFYSNALSIALRWTRKLQERFEELSTKVVEQRLAGLVLSLAGRLGAGVEAVVNISDEELAQMAGTNLFTVNKLVHVWQRLGYVNKSRRRLLILDRVGLVNISGSPKVTDDGDGSHSRQ
jgi:CRP/FNR family transcriptional regulator, nitrogen oxide reductase regulator